MPTRPMKVKLAAAMVLAFGMLGCSSAPFCPDCARNTPVTGLHYTLATTATVGAAITPNLPAAQGGVPTGYAVIDGSLPPGLSLDPVTGIITGTPTAAGAFEVTVQAGNAAGTTSQVLTFFEEPAAATPASGGGNTTPASTSALAIVYNSPQAYPAQLNIAPQTPTLTSSTGIAAADALTANTMARVLASRAARSGALAAGGGYTFTVSDGALPPGLVLNADGSISGTPTSAGEYIFTISASDGTHAASWTLSYRVTLAGSLTLNYPSPSMLLTQNLAAATTAPVISNPVQGAATTFAVTGGSLPPGLSMQPDGSFAGTPTTLGAFPFTVTAVGGGQASTFSVLITVIPTPVAASLVPSSATPLFNSPVTLTPTFSGGTATLGTTGAGSSDLSASATTGTACASGPITAATTFTLTVTDAGGASATTTCLVTPQTVSITGIQAAATTLTSGASETLAATVTGGATGRVTWAASGGTWAGSIWTAPATPAAYTLTATSVDDPSRSLSIRITVVAADSPATVSAPAEVTAGQAGYSASVVPQADATYAWAITGGTIQGSLTGTSVTFTPGAAGSSAILACTVTNAAGTSATPGTATSTIVAAPVATVTAPATVTAGLAGYTASVPAQSGCTYAWTVGAGTITAGAGTRSITFTPAASGPVTLGVVVTNAAGTAATGTAASAIDGAPLATVTAPALVTAGLAGYTASVPAQTGCTYAWTVGAATVTAGAGTRSISFTPASSGPVTFSVVVTNAVGTFATGTATAVIEAPPVATVTAPASVTASLAGYAASVPAQTGCTYAWTVGAATVTAGAGTASITFTPAASGPVTFSVVVTNPAGTSATGTASSAVVTAPVANVTAPASVSANLAGYTASVPAQTGCTYVWTVGGASVTAGAGTHSITFTPAGSGTVTFSVVVTNANGTPATGTASASIVGAPVATVTAPASVTANLAGYTASVPVQAGSTYAWTVGAAAVTAGAGTPSITFTPATSGPVTFSVVVTNALGVAATGTASATVVAAPVATVTAPASVTASLVGYTASVPVQTGCTYAWTVGAATVTAGAGTPSITFTPALSGPVTFSVVVTNALGAAATGTASATVVAAPVATVTAPVSVTASQTGYTASVPAQTGCTYAWTVGAAAVTAGAGTPSITFTPATSGPVTFSVLVTNSLGTPATGTASSLIVAAPAISIFTASPSSITTGSGSVLAYTFSGGTGSIDQSVGAVTSNGSSNITPTLTTTYTLTVTNTLGATATATATVTVSSVPAPSITAFTGNPTTISAGQGTLLAFTFAHGTGSIDNAVGAVTSGGSVAVSPAETTTYTLTVTGTGTPATQSVTVTVLDFVSKWLYVANDHMSTGSNPRIGTGTLSAFVLNDATGALTPVGPDVSLGSGAASALNVTCDPLARFVFAADNTNSAISAFTINQTTGALTPVGSPVSTDSYPWGLAVDPAGNHLYVRCDGFIDVFTIDSTTGALDLIHAYGTPSGGAILDATGIDDANNGDIVVHPSGRFLYSAGQASSMLDVFAVDPATGLLSAGVAYATLPSTSSNGPIGVAVDPTGAYVAVKGEVGTSYITTYAINIETGVLTSPTQSSALPGSNAFNGLCFSPTKNILYTAFYNGGSQGPAGFPSLGAFGISLSTGNLTALTGSAYTWFTGSTFSGSDNIVVSRNGKWAYATDWSDNQIGFGAVNADGSLPASAGHLYTTGINPVCITIAGVLQAPPAIAVTSIAPASGVPGQAVEVLGTGFAGATAVYFGTTPALSFTVNSSTDILAYAPNGTGTQDITVVAPAGTSAVTSADLFDLIPSA